MSSKVLPPFRSRLNYTRPMVDVPRMYRDRRDPTEEDVLNRREGDEWLNTQNGTLWYLAPSGTGTASWKKLCVQTSGTWTPIISMATSAGAYNATSAQASGVTSSTGWYRTSGRLCFFAIDFTFHSSNATGLGATGTNAIFISLPKVISTATRARDATEKAARAFISDSANIGFESTVSTTLFMLALHEPTDTQDPGGLAIKGRLAARTKGNLDAMAQDLDRSHIRPGAMLSALGSFVFSMT